MGKKRITKRFAKVKRMISSQDHRMYAFPEADKRTSRRRKNRMKKGRRNKSIKHQKEFSSNKCNSSPIQTKVTFVPVLHAQQRTRTTLSNPAWH